MTKEEFIVMGYRLHGDNRPEEEILAQHEQARLRSVAVFSSSPLYQARAAKDPEYWNKFSVGGLR